MELYGFSDESQTIADHLAKVQNGATTIAFIEGYAGEGKTSLLVGSVARALERQFVTSLGADRLAASQSGESLSKGMCSCTIFPPPHADDGIRQLVSWLAGLQQTPMERKQPLLIALDDLQEMNSTNARMLTDLLVNDLYRPVFWLFARREGYGNQVGSQLVGRRHPEIVRLWLQPMCSVDATALVSQLAGGPPSTELLALVNQAGGNRLLIVELVKGLLAEHGQEALRVGCGLDALVLPECLTDVVERLLAPLSSDCRRLLELASALGHTVSLRQLVRVTGTAIGGLLQILLEAVETGVLTADQSGQIQFRQELVRRFLVSRIPRGFLYDLTSTEALQPDIGKFDYSASTPQVPPKRLGSLLQLQGDTEWKIAKLVADGLTNQQIATRMSLSPHTVSYHLRKIFRRLDVRSRVELAARSCS